MSEMDPEEAVLKRARRGLSPRAEDAERVRASLSLAIAAGVAPSTATAEDSGGWLRSELTARVLRTALTLAIGAGAGYMVGQREGVSQSNVETPAVSSPAPRVDPHPGPRIEPPRSPAPELAPRELAPVRTPAPERSAPPRPAGIAEEVRLVERVERALREHNPRLALGLLSELDRVAPRGELVEERHAARVMAECELDASGASVAFAGFEKAYPGSAYLGRVRETCVRGRE